jgi:hypothetical protein
MTTRITPMLIGAADSREAMMTTLIIRTYDPRPRGHGGRGIMLVAALLAVIFVFGVSHARHYLDRDDSAATIITTVTASAVPPATPQAGAGTPSATYGTNHAADVCSTLTRYPSLDGVMGVAEAITQESGLTAYQAGEAIGEAVYTSCPQFVPLIQAFAHQGTTLA